MDARSERDSVVSFERVTFTYDQGDEIFRDVSMEVPRGDFCFVSGESGAGKSTLLKIIYGANPNYLGSVKIFNQEISGLKNLEIAKLRRRIGIVFQEFQLLEHLSVLENVAVPLILQDFSEHEARVKANQILSWLGLGSFLHKSPRTLSGGQRQRIAAARAVSGNPDIIIADEPTGHVDDENAALLMRLFHEMNQQGKTIFMATHNSEILANYPGRHFTLQSGKLIEYEATGKKSLKSVGKKVAKNA